MPPGSMPPGSMPPGIGGGAPPDLHPHSSGPLFPLDLLKPEAPAAVVPPPESTAPGRLRLLLVAYTPVTH